MRKQVHSGEFDYKGVVYHGTSEPLITPASAAFADRQLNSGGAVETAILVDGGVS